MSEYHDTNEDERDWKEEYANRRNIGRQIADDATTERLVAMLRKIVVNRGCPHMLAGYDERIAELLQPG